MLTVGMNAKEARQSAMKRYYYGGSAEGLRRLEIAKAEIRAFREELKKAIESSVQMQECEEIRFSFCVDTEQTFYPEVLDAIQNEGFDVYVRVLPNTINGEEGEEEKTYALKDCNKQTLAWGKFVGYKFCF